MSVVFLYTYTYRRKCLSAVIHKMVMLFQIIEDACKKHGFNPDQYDLK